MNFQAPVNSFQAPNNNIGGFQQPNAFFNPNLLNDPVASMAVKYGSNLADQGKEYVAQNVIQFNRI
jgi:hypothetical protein